MSNQKRAPAGKAADAAPAPPKRSEAEIQASAIEEPTESARRVFRMEDWLAGLFATLVSGIAFFYYMAPEVTLQDSGELVTGAFTFGVPHPPGYPLWALLGFVWSHLIVPFGNPAWRMGTLSAFTGAMTVGVLTITMTRSLRLLLHSLPWSEREDDRTERWIALAVGTSAALLFGFNRGVWLWACVSEMRVLNQFSFVMMTCTFLAWMIQPQRRGFLGWTLLLYGLSIANHQTVAVMVVPFAVGAFAVGLEEFLAQQRRKPGQPFWPTLMASLGSFWELSTAGALAGVVGLGVLSWLLSTLPNSKAASESAFSGAVLSGLAGAAGLIAGRATGWWNARRALLFAGLFLAGAAFYFYMPLAASTNPPMNWGYAATKEGFWHAVRRGQYEQLQTAHVFSDEFILKINVFSQGVIHQYSWVICLFAAVTLAGMVWGAWRVLGVSRRVQWILIGTFLGGLPLLLMARHMMKETGPLWIVLMWAAFLALVIGLVVGAWDFFKPRGRAWMVFLWAAFLSASLGLLIIINPKLDKQEQEITIKFFAPAHGFYGMMIGYGIAVLLSFLARRGPFGIPWSWPVRILSIALLALPVVPWKRNLDLCNLHGHDFGYLFGYLMFEPGGGYPPMEKGAVLYGGTDPGRFVPTYMIFCESRVKPQDRFRNPDFDRSDVYIITQNALADNTYMSYIRDHYDFSRPNLESPKTIAKFEPWQQAVFARGWTWLDRAHTYPPEPIYIPEPGDTQQAFERFYREVQAGLRPPNSEIKFENGRIQITGAQGVMEINGILAQWIFEKNKDKHAFYVEESYIINWMYPYLRPAGIIMKIEKEPLPTPQKDPKQWGEIVARDRAYWDKLAGDFLARDDFRRNADAKKSFSKLRGAIAGLYQSRGLLDEAEYAYRQSLKLCPESPEVNFRLAGLLASRRRYAEARSLIEAYQKVDPYNHSSRSYLESLAGFEKDTARLAALETQVNQAQGRLDMATGVEMVGIYQRLGMDGPFQALTRSILSNSNLPSEVTLVVAQICVNARNWDLVAQSLRRHLESDPKNVKIWIELAHADLARNKPEEAMPSIRRAVDLGGERAREALRNDERFGPLRARLDFQRLVLGPAPRSLPAGPSLPFMPGW